MGHCHRLLLLHVWGWAAEPHRSPAPPASHLQGWDRAVPQGKHPQTPRSSWSAAPTVAVGPPRGTPGAPAVPSSLPSSHGHWRRGGRDGFGRDMSVGGVCWERSGSPSPLLLCRLIFYLLSEDAFSQPHLSKSKPTAPPREEQANFNCAPPPCQPCSELSHKDCSLRPLMRPDMRPQPPRPPDPPLSHCPLSPRPRSCRRCGCLAPGEGPGGWGCSAAPGGRQGHWLSGTGLCPCCWPCLHFPVGPAPVCGASGTWGGVWPCGAVPRSLWMVCGDTLHCWPLLPSSVTAPRTARPGGAWHRYIHGTVTPGPFPSWSSASTTCAGAGLCAAPTGCTVPPPPSP